jgi:hypothetical protein
METYIRETRLDEQGTHVRSLAERCTALAGGPGSLGQVFAVSALET